MYVNSIIRFGNLRQRGPAESKLPCIKDSRDQPRREASNLREVPIDHRQARSIKGRVKRKNSPATGESEVVRCALQPM